MNRPIVEPRTKTYTRLFYSFQKVQVLKLYVPIYFVSAKVRSIFYTSFNFNWLHMTNNIEYFVSSFVH
jgi:hypothetical protein